MNAMFRAAILMIALSALAPQTNAQEHAGIFFKVCIVQDKSGSSKSYGTPQIKAEDFFPIFDLQLEHGGEIGFGVLDESSNWPLVRFYLTPKEPLPEKRKSFNVREQVKLRRQYNKALVAWKGRQDLRQERFQLQREIFLAEVSPHITRRLDAHSSDVAGALVRCNRFLAEQDVAIEGITYIPFILFISDVEHAVSREYKQKFPDRDFSIPRPSALPFAKNIYVVNGRLHKGSLATAGYQVTAFEGITAAIRYIISTTKTHQAE